MSKKHNPGFVTMVDAARARVRQCSVDDVLKKRARKERFRLIDVREDDEWRAGRLPKAEHIGKGVLERDIETKCPDKDEMLILYCGGGYRSALAAESLGRMGYSRVVSMDGGWRAWKERGLPTTKAKGTRPGRRAK